MSELDQQSIEDLYSALVNARKERDQLRAERDALRAILGCIAYDTNDGRALTTKTAERYQELALRGLERSRT